MSLKICIVGAAGRMGRNIAKVVSEDKDAEISGAADRKGSEFIGSSLYELAGAGSGGPEIMDDIENAAAGADVIIDFTSAEATSANLPVYEKIGLPLVIGGTGFSPEGKRNLELLGRKLAILASPNMSLGVNAALKLVEEAAASLKGYDVEISEIHHRMKKDAPSGTALALAEAAAKGAGLNLEKNAVYCRRGLTGQRKDDEIGIQAIRGGDVAGDHTVYFFGNGERIEITHRAHTRETFARGAVTAAKWIKGKPAGFYGMADVLF